MNKKPDNKGETGPKESRSVFHDDDNLQDEQAEFDAANAEMTPEKAAEAIKKLMARDKEKPCNESKDAGHS